MILAIKILIGFVALEHIYIMYFEMFAWTTKGRRFFRGFPKHLFEETKVLAANQGLYNGFLAAGLIWSLLISDPLWWKYVAIFFLGCVLVAGIYGSLTASRKIFVFQGLIPAITLGLIFLSW